MQVSKEKLAQRKAPLKTNLNGAFLLNPMCASCINSLAGNKQAVLID